MDQDYIHNWKKIIGGYALIALVGSLAIIVGFMAFNTVRTDQKIQEVYQTIEKHPIRQTRTVSRPINTQEVSASRWAIVKKADTKTYSSTGKFLQRINLGTIVYIYEIKTNSDGDLALCALNPDSSKDRAYIRTRDLEIQSGTISQITETEKTLRIQRVHILSEIDKKRLQSLMKSPCYAEYQRASDTYKAFYVRGKQMTAKRNAARGAEKMEYSDELQRMKNEGAALMRDLNGAKKKMTTWQHTSNIAGNPAIALLRKDLIQVEQQIRDIEQGL
ncbi:MAG: hypothetical protein KAH23_00740 [Kiritimatiellae bacterium]|nr:hypothetical protein [Kiritimatiellia bacterium]